MAVNRSNEEKVYRELHGKFGKALEEGGSKPDHDKLAAIEAAAIKKGLLDPKNSNYHNGGAASFRAQTSLAPQTLTMDLGSLAGGIN